jgi:hypothetical protein
MTVTESRKGVEGAFTLAVFPCEQHSVIGRDHTLHCHVLLARHGMLLGHAPETLERARGIPLGEGRGVKMNFMLYYTTERGLGDMNRKTYTENGYGSFIV